MGEIGGADFTEFAVRELGGLVRLAVMLTGDREPARDLVQDVMLKAHSRRSRVSTADDPKRYVKAMVVNAHLSSLTGPLPGGAGTTRPRPSPSTTRSGGVCLLCRANNARCSCRATTSG